ncbi:MAG: hypothetical protein JWN97_2701 [Nocardioides sp.]|nr:hypothetical protein [Nocardioides sp.]
MAVNDNLGTDEPVARSVQARSIWPAPNWTGISND